MLNVIAAVITITDPSEGDSESAAKRSQPKSSQKLLKTVELMY